MRGKRQISTGGGFDPRWRRDGNEIFFQDLSRRVAAVEIRAKGDTLEIGAVRPLFPATAGGLYRYDTSSDGKRFLLFLAPEENAAVPLTLLQNWTAPLRK
jgi:hypothetical protein